MTRVVNIHHDHDFDVYIGRAGHGFDGYFGNPHRREPLLSFAAYFYNRIREDAEFRDRVSLLRGKTLGCFCRPHEGFQRQLLCHGQIIAAWLDGCDPLDID